MPNNVVVNISKISFRSVLFKRQTLHIAEIRENPVVINVPLRVNLPYYLWIKDRSGNVMYQTFFISKI